MSLLHPLNRRPFALLATAEAVGFATAAALATVLTDGSAEPPALGVYAFILTLGLFTMGLYSRRQRFKLYGALLRAAAAITGGSLLVALLAGGLPSFGLCARTLLCAWPLAVTSTLVLRQVFENLIDEKFFQRKVLILGAGKQAASVARLRRRVDRRGFRIAGFVPFPGEVTPAEISNFAAPGLELLQYCRANAIEEVVVALDEKRRDFPLQALLDVRLSGIPVVDVVDFLERETGTVRLDLVNPSWFIFSRGFDQSTWRLVSQRAFDIIMSALLLLIAAVPMALVVLAIKLTEGFKAPVFYKQLRVGLEGRHFNVLKFRSMRIDAERFGAVWATENDPRITPVGRLMRKTRLDELPQIFNVFKGDMSFVGPRPERPQFVDQFEERIPYYRERHAVKPGITGWAQLCYAYGASEEDAFYKLQYDLYYVKRHSLLFDLVILLQTIEVVLWGKGR